MKTSGSGPLEKKILAIQNVEVCYIYLMLPFSSNPALLSYGGVGLCALVALDYS